jgi:hypothetical protein
MTRPPKGLTLGIPRDVFFCPFTGWLSFALRALYPNVLRTVRIRGGRCRPRLFTFIFLRVLLFFTMHAWVTFRRVRSILLCECSASCQLFKLIESSHRFPTFDLPRLVYPLRHFLSARMAAFLSDSECAFLKYEHV